MSDPMDPKRTARLLQAVADGSRLRIIRRLLTGPRYVSQLAQELNAEVVNVSHHLSVLRQNGLVRDEKRGRFVVYSLNPDYFREFDERSARLDLGGCRLHIPAGPD
jgi:DNA-binding transcriptional ArsR family regulator